MVEGGSRARPPESVAVLRQPRHAATAREQPPPGTADRCGPRARAVHGPPNGGGGGLLGRRVEAQDRAERRRRRSDARDVRRGAWTLPRAADVPAPDRA